MATAASYDPPPFGAPRLALAQRLAVLLAGCVLIGLLATAARLTPSPQGLGTHRQLGLPACTMVQWFGVRCPSCGMTTSWAHMTRGHVAAAFRANAGGALLAVMAVVTGPWLLATGICGRWVVGPPHEGLTLGVGLTIVIVTLIDWTLRLSSGW